MRTNFWREYPLEELTHTEWEALCDGCGTCCLIKFIDDDEETGEQFVEYTDVACKLLDCSTGWCSDYDNRQKSVPECVSLKPHMIADMMWLPNSCAYKRLYLGLDLPKWHFLITNDRAVTTQGMRQDGVGVAGRCVSEVAIDEEEIEERIVVWVDV